MGMYKVVGYNEDKETLIVRTSSYMKAVTTKEKARRSNKYDSVLIEETFTPKEHIAHRELRLKR